MAVHVERFLLAPVVERVAEHAPEGFDELDAFAFGELECFGFGVVAGSVVVHAGHERVAGVEGCGVEGVVGLPLVGFGERHQVDGAGDDDLGRVGMFGFGDAVTDVGLSGFDVGEPFQLIWTFWRMVSNHGLEGGRGERPTFVVREDPFAVRVALFPERTY